MYLYKIHIYNIYLLFVSIHSTSEASSTTKPQTSNSSTSPRKATLKSQLKGISSSGTALKTAVRVLVKGGKKKTIVGSKAKNISSKQVPKTVKVGKLPLKGAVKKVKKKPLAVKSEASGNQEVVANFEQNPKLATCETILNKSVAFVKETLALDSEEPMAGIEVTGAEHVEGAAAKCAVFTPSEDHNDDDSCTNAEDEVTQPVVQNIEACITEDLCRSSKLTSSEDLPDENNSKIVEDTAVLDASSYSKLTWPEDKPDGDVYVGDEPNAESSPDKSPPLSHQPTEENSGNVEGVDTKDLRSVSTFTSSEDQPERAVDQALVVPLVETLSDEPMNVAALEPENDATLDKAIEPVTTEQTASGQSGPEDGEIVEVRSDTEDVQEHCDHQLSCVSDESCPTETATQAPEHIQLESTLKEAETKMAHPHEQDVGGKKTKLAGGVGKTEAVLQGNGKV